MSSGQKSLGGKVREMRLAIELEKKYTKDQILEGYLNIVFFSRDAYGIEAASRHFFSTNARSLTRPQAALLGGLVKSPTFYNPAVNPDNAIQRRNHVLDAMLARQDLGSGARRRRHRGRTHPQPGETGLRRGGNGISPGPP